MKKILFLILLILSIFDKIHSQVNMDWVEIYQHMSGGGGGFRYVTTDNSGNTMSLGGVLTNNGDYLLLKYDSNGKLLWAETYDNIGQEDSPFGMVVDDSDNVYVTGVSRGEGTDYDYATVKFNSFGVRQWVSRYNGVGNGIDWPYAIAIDSRQNVYVTGKSIIDMNNYGFDILTIKYNSNGEQQWTKRYYGTKHLGSDLANAITVDKSNNIYIVGSCSDSVGGTKFCTIKYDSGGVQQWVGKYNGTLNRADIGYFIKSDALGDVFVTGVSFNEMYYFNFATVKYNSEGIEQWSRKYIGSANFEDRVAGLEVDNLGNAYVMGRSTESGTGYDYTTIKYDLDGNQIWLRRYHNGFNDIPMDMKIDLMGNIYITGQSDGEGTDDDIATVKYDSSGNQKWAIRYNYSGQSDDESRAIALDKIGNVYIAGKSDNIYVTIKYSQIITGANPLLIEQPFEYTLGQNYPNPFNPKTVTSYELRVTGFIDLKVFDALGKKVATLVNENKPAGKYEVEFDGSDFPSGIYFYSLRVDGVLIDTKRMALLK